MRNWFRKDDISSIVPDAEATWIDDYEVTLTQDAIENPPIAEGMTCAVFQGEDMIGYGRIIGRPKWNSFELQYEATLLMYSGEIRHGVLAEDLERGSWNRHQMSRGMLTCIRNMHA